MNQTEKRRTPPANCLGETLRHWRSKNDWPLKKMASEFDVTEGTWSRWETGTRSPSVEHLRRLSVFLHVPICDLLYGRCSRCPSCGFQDSPQAGIRNENSKSARVSS